ncbi:aminopeptidase N-like isoform X1 [Danaus plexippus]|uniref:aminopeptidase N-like isoform X1 n=1 Tax=Danaus plexippus TaxID=13037 RepID=UPI002AB023B5|nr:aminopeptidase N-like isoform X1 [Danaus plexippus]
MPLSTSRQQFLAYESHGDPDIHYTRKGGVFISTCICAIFVIFSILIAILVGIIVYYITYIKISQKSEDFWDETDPFGQSSSPSPDLRLPSSIIPSFYRLKIKADLENKNFSGDVYITIKANRKVNQVILHSKDLVIGHELTLTEQIYEKVETLHSAKSKREIVTENNTVTETNSTLPSATTVDTVTADNATYVETTDNSSSILTTTPPVNTQVTHSNVRNINITSVKFRSGDRLILNLGSYLTPYVDYTLQVPFKGNISSSLTGFYQSTYTEDNQVRQLAVTQFEPTSARAAFPCFDEPEFKAKFEISIAHRNNVSVLSNMKIAIEEPVESDPEWKWTHFERSVNMSTYLVAYVLSDFVNVETNYTSVGNITKPIRIWTRPSLISKANYALTIVPKLLSFYEEIFGVPYALDKMDLIAIPDFSSGAMENWGLITFRETTLLYDEIEGIPREKQNVAIDVAHELAHQWFGDLVTMKWWTDLWLNEGFATYIEYVGVDHIAPEWDMFESFTRDKMNLLRTDALKNTAPVSQKVIDASEISQKFDEISYSKGANLIRMLNHTISKELFHKGLLIYLNLWKYRNAEENDLWQAMSLATKESPRLKGLSVVDFMNTWTKQPGYPVVRVLRNYENDYVTFEQNLFTSNKNNKKEQKWQIPISYSTNSSDWSTEAKFFLNDDAITTQIDINSSQALYVNVEAIGYYRVNYDHRNWDLLNKALKNGTIKSPIAKAQLIDDAFNLAKTNQLEYSYALGLTTCVIDGEESKTVWDLLLNNMAFLSHNLRATSGYMYFQDYMKIILKKQLERLNYGLNKPKDDNEAFLIENLVLWECLVESPRCLQWTREQFETWTSKPNMTDNPIPSFLRSLVYNMAIKNGGRREFEILWNIFLNTTDPNIKSLIISNLPSTKEESLITLLLEKSLSEIPTQYAISAWSVDAPIGTKIAQDFLIDNFDKVYKRFNEMDSFMFAGVLNGAFGFITTNDELNRFKKFALDHKSELQPMSHTLQKIADSGAVRISWINTHARNINNWFKTYVEEHSTNSQTTDTPNETITDSNVTLSS